MDNEWAAVKESKLWDHLWDKLPLTLRQEDIAWFVGTSLSEDDCASLHEGEGAFDDAEGDDECHHWFPLHRLVIVLKSYIFARNQACLAVLTSTLRCTVHLEVSAAENQPSSPFWASNCNELRF